MTELPNYVGLVFAACVLTAFGFIYYAVQRAAEKNSNTPVIFATSITVWVFIISILTFLGFFQDFDSRPPRLILALAPTILFIATVFTIPKSRAYIARMPITTLTYIHIIRVPVEIVLWWLFMHGWVAEAMTFEGVNYDILSGISAPFAGLFFVGLKSKSNFAAIAWNVLALGLLINIVSRAVMATPYFFNEAIFDQPNLAVFYFPYILLPLFVVPAVFFSHMVCLYKLFFVPESNY